MKKIILKIIIILATIGVIYGGYEMIKELTNPNKIDEIETQKILKSNDKSLAIWIQETNGEWHEAEDRSKWPDPSTHGFVGAECTDSEGHDIDWEKVLTFSLADKTATIKTKQTTYCTLYFATGEPAIDHLKAKGGSAFAGGGEHTTEVDGLYRFKGTQIDVTNHNLNNYICFGTIVESTCTANDSGNYMYRIIGITSEVDSEIGLEANQLKIIRAVPSSESQPWNSIYTSDIKWDSSEVKRYLNETFYDAIFVTEQTRIPDASYWESIISSHKWYNADQTNTPETTEPKTSQTNESKIGLMYASDYYNSWAYANNVNSWLFIANGWVNNSTTDEWTMSRFEYNSDIFWTYAWYVLSSGAFEYVNGRVEFEYAVRPVFYLIPRVNLTGEGTKEHPYIITSLPNN